MNPLLHSATAADPSGAAALATDAGQSVAGEIGDDVFPLIEACIATRRNHSAKSLVAPGPAPAQLRQLFAMAAAAPDHGAILPWRFVVVPQQKRALLGDAFAAALAERDPHAGITQFDDARAKAQRSPFLAIAILRGGPAEADIPLNERLISLGAAIQNILIGANALGFGAGLTSGKAMSSEPVRRLLNLEATESAICCINIGTAARAPRARSKSRADTAEFISVL